MLKAHEVTLENAFNKLNRRILLKDVSVVAQTPIFPQSLVTVLLTDFADPLESRRTKACILSPTRDYSGALLKEVLSYVTSMRGAVPISITGMAKKTDIASYQVPLIRVTAVSSSMPSVMEGIERIARESARYVY